MIQSKRITINKNRKNRNVNLLLVILTDVNAHHVMPMVTEHIKNKEEQRVAGISKWNRNKIA